MNKAYQRKLRACLALIGLLLLPVSCSLNFSSTKNTVVLKNMDSSMFNSMIKDKYWGNKTDCASSDICIHFRADNGNSGKITVKDRSGQEIPVGSWTYTADLVTKGTFSFQNTAGISARYEIRNTSIVLIVECQGQDLHLLKN